MPEEQRYSAHHALTRTHYRLLAHSRMGVCLSVRVSVFRRVCKLQNAIVCEPSGFGCLPMIPQQIITWTVLVRLLLFTPFDIVNLFVLGRCSNKP